MQFKTRCLAMMKSLKSCKREIKPLIGGPGLAVSWKPFRVSRAGCRHSAGHLCMCFSPINGSGPAYLSELQHVDTPSLTLYSSSDTRMLKIQQCECKTHGFRTFSCFGPHIWNSLPQDLRHCSALSSFKAKLETFLFSLYFHPN